ncbi:methyl-accepting chemotaxis protein, partial [Magnetospirillum aberrantis]
MEKNKGLTVKGRIYGGFGIVLAFLVALAAVALLGFATVRDNVADYARVLVNTSAIQQIDRNVAGLRRNIFVYVDEGNQKALDRANELRTVLRRDLNEVAARVRLAETKAAMDRMVILFERYSGNFDKVIELRTERERLVREGTDVIGRDTSAIVDRLIAARIQERNFDALVSLSAIDSHFSTARLAVLRFQGRMNEAEAELAIKQLNEAQSLLETASRNEMGNARTQIEDLLGRVKSYRDSFTRQRDATLSYRKLVEDMGVLATEFGDLARDAAERQNKQLSLIEEATFSVMNSRSTIAAVASALAVVLGLFAAYLIARSILVPINRMTDAMGDLAGGRLDVTVPALERGDEIGQMAQAVQVFKQNAVDKKRMEEEAEAAREAQAKAEAEQRGREAAIVAEVAEVAKAASEGDLDRRIELAGKDGFLLNLCEGVNNLVNLTGIALKDVAEVLAAVARGDLTRRITNNYGGLFGQLKGDVNQTADKLFEIVTNINSSAGQIGSAAAEVAAGSQDLSERSEQQASA